MQLIGRTACDSNWSYTQLITPALLPLHLLSYLSLFLWYFHFTVPSHSCPRLDTSVVWACRFVPHLCSLHSIRFSFVPSSPFHLSSSLSHLWSTQQPTQNRTHHHQVLMVMDPYFIFMGEIIWNCVWWVVGVTGEGGDEMGVCMCVHWLGWGWGVYRVYMEHHYHIKDMLDSLS